jgi:hypothetical protein
MHQKVRISFFLLIALLICTAADYASPLDVSLVQLIAEPKNYHGAVVRVIGFVKLDFEGTAINLHKDDYKYGITKNGLWLEVTDEIDRKKTEIDQQYVLLEGKFNANEMGHMGLWSGSIQQISRFQIWNQKDGKK